MSGDIPEDPHCPECGEPIGATATYCMHCSADISGQEPVAPGEGPSGSGRPDAPTASGAPGRHPLDPDGVVDDALTVLVGIVGGLVVGGAGTFVLLVLTRSGWALAFGFVAWLGATAYLVRRRYVLDAVAKSAYGVAAVLAAVPVVALTVEGGLPERGAFFFVLFLFVVVPAGVAAGIGWIASRYVPGDAGDEG